MNSLGDQIGEVESLKFVSTSLVLVAFMLVVGCGAQALTPSRANAPVVKVTIQPNLLITFSPKEFKHGTVVLKVNNRTDNAHPFTINGVTTKSIKPHTIMAVTVTFKRPSIYAASLPDCGYLSLCEGAARPEVGAIGQVKVT